MFFAIINQKKTSETAPFECALLWVSWSITPSLIILPISLPLHFCCYFYFDVYVCDFRIFDGEYMYEKCTKPKQIKLVIHGHYDTLCLKALAIVISVIKTRDVIRSFFIDAKRYFFSRILKAKECIQLLIKFIQRILLHVSKPYSLCICWVLCMKMRFTAAIRRNIDQ